MTKLKLLITFLFCLLLGSCGSKKEGVGEFIGLKFGVEQTHPVKEGPRGPPVFNGDLREFYEINFPNQEFSFVGVATTKITPEDEKEGLKFTKEGVIWGAFLNQNNIDCKKADYDKLKNYIIKNYGAKITNESITDTPIGNSKILTQHYGYLHSPYVAWQVICSSGEYGGKTVVIRDYSVLKRFGNEKLQKVVDDSMKEAQEILKRKID